MAYRYVSTRSDWCVVRRWLEAQGIDDVRFDETCGELCPYWLDVDVESRRAVMHIHRRYLDNPLGSLYLRMASADWLHYTGGAYGMRHDVKWLKRFLALLLMPVDMKES